MDRRPTSGLIVRMHFVTVLLIGDYGELDIGDGENDGDNLQVENDNIWQIFPSIKSPLTAYHLSSQNVVSYLQDRLLLLHLGT